MTGRNLLWCARQHGHSVQVMLSMYGAWIEGSTEADIEAIKHSMQAGAAAETNHGPRKRITGPIPFQSPVVPTQVPPKCHHRVGGEG